MPPATTTKPPTCAVCNKPASSRCARCAEGVDPSGTNSTTWYCSKACQATHWPTHKLDCTAANHRKHLYGAGEVLQQCFYTWRRKYWSHPKCDFTRDADGRLHVHTNADDEDDDSLHPFPGEDLPEVEKHAVLAWSGTATAMLILPALVRQLLNGCCIDVKEVTIDAKPSDLLVWSTCCKSGCKHKEKNYYEIYCVTLKDGNTYALDATSAQYGVGSVMPWATFLATRSESVLSTQKVGTMLGRFTTQREKREKRARITGADIVDANYKSVSLFLAYEQALAKTVKEGKAMGAEDFKTAGRSTRRRGRGFWGDSLRGLTLRSRRWRRRGGLGSWRHSGQGWLARREESRDCRALGLTGFAASAAKMLEKTAAAAF